MPNWLYLGRTRPCLLDRVGMLARLIRVRSENFERGATIPSDIAVMFECKAEVADWRCPLFDWLDNAPLLQALEYFGIRKVVTCPIL